MNAPLVRNLLQECWHEARRARHRSLVTSLLIRETFGGEIRTGRDDGSLFFNRILGTDYCFTTMASPGGGHEMLEWPELMERIPTVAAELLPMREMWRRKLARRLLRSLTS
jgi:hypothetical protein